MPPPELQCEVMSKLSKTRSSQEHSRFFFIGPQFSGYWFSPYFPLVLTVPKLT